MISGQSSTAMNGQHIRSTDLVDMRMMEFDLLLFILRRWANPGKRTSERRLSSGTSSSKECVGKYEYFNRVSVPAGASGYLRAMRIQSGPPQGIFLWCSHSMVSLEPVVCSTVVAAII